MSDCCVLSLCLVSDTALINSLQREREYIFSIGRALMEEVELNEVLRVILRATANILASKVGLVLLVEPEDETFRIVATYGIPPKTLDQFKPLTQGVSFSEISPQEALDKLREGVRAVVQAADPTLENSIGFPLHGENGIIGVIFNFIDHEYDISPERIRFLESFGAWAGIAVKNAKVYDRLNAEKQRLNAIIQQSADGVMILDAGLNITEFNAALVKMTSIPSKQAIGASHYDLMDNLQLRTETDLHGAVANGWPLPNASQPLYVEGDLPLKDGRKVSLAITYAPLINEKGKMNSIIANVRDLTRYREEEKLQKTFISIVSHELKTPVSIIKGYAGTLQRDDLPWERELKNEYLQTIEEEADSLTDLIDNLLEASRLQAGTFSLDINEDVQLSHIARSVVRKFATQTTSHTFTDDWSHRFPEIQADEKRITQVFNNLISNAIKYSPKGGEISASGEEFNEQVVVHIKDHGIGIPEEHRHRIFQQFSRLDNALSRQTEGTGLGLFLTKAIVQAHGGQIWFESNGDQPGTTFSFSLPIQNPNKRI